jgi:hypothetical protein
MTELKDQITKLERTVGVTDKGQQRTRQVIIRGARGLLWSYTVGEGNEVLSERVLSDEEAVKLLGSDEDRDRGNIKRNALHNANWRMTHWPEKYPTMEAALVYGRDQDACNSENDEPHDQVYDELLSVEGVSREQPET